MRSNKGADVLDLKFQEFKVGQTFKSRIIIDKDDFQKYISFAKTKNILHEKPELAAVWNGWRPQLG